MVTNYEGDNIEFKDRSPSSPGTGYRGLPIYDSTLICWKRIINTSC